MAKFNQKSKGSNTTVNHEGAKAYKLSSKLELYSAVVTTSLSKKFYEDENDRISRIQSLIANVDPEFVAKLAVYARENMHLRSVPLVVATELAKVHNGDDLVRKVVRRVVSRADELTELLAFYSQANSLNKGDKNRPKKLYKLSKQMQKGLADCLNKFSEYDFGKYNRDNEIKLRDVLFLVHPKAKDKAQQELFNKITNKTLETPFTWETQLSALGQQKFENEDAKKKAFKEKWEELIDSGKLGYMALLRNLRNILESGVSKKHIAKVCESLSSKEAVLRSKQFPFRFLSAYQEVENVPSADSSGILDALEEAMRASVENVKGFGYDTTVCIACDVSGSMNSLISPKSKIENYDIGLTLGMLLQHKCKSVITGIFGDSWKIKNLPKTNILENVEKLKGLSSEVGWSTNGYLVVKDLLDRNVEVDKVMLFTDCQLWDSAGSSWGRRNTTNISDLWKQYKVKFPKAKIYLFDLAGYGNTPISVQSGDGFLISGWSNEVFNVLEALENGESTLSNIEKIVL